MSERKLNSLSLDVSDNLTDEMLRTHVMPLVRKYVLEGKGAIEVFNGIEVRRVVNQGY